MTNPSLDHLRTFVTAYRAGSLTEAATLLGISQPTATAHIRALEVQFGHPLFTRTRSGIVPTANAEALAREVSEHVDALDDISSLGVGLESTSRIVRVGGPAELLTTVVLANLALISAAVGSPLRFTFGLPDGLLHDLRAGQLDVVLSSIRPWAHGVDSIPVYDEEFVLVGSPRWADADHTAQSLASIPVIAYADDLPIVRRYWRTVFRQRPSDLRLAAVIPDLRGIAEAVVSGLGMSVLPRYLITAQLRSGALVELFHPDMAPLNTVYLAVRAGETARNHALIEQLHKIDEWVGEIS